MAEETTTEETTEETTTEETTEDQPLSAEEAKALREESQRNADEANRLKRVAAENAKKAKDAERAAKQAAEEKAKQDGDWQKVAEEKEREAAEAADRAKQAEDSLATFERTNRVNSLASRLKFRDPTDAAKFLSVEEQDDERKAEAALKRLAREKPYLVDEQRRSGAAIDGGNGAQTPEQAHQETLKQMFGG